jgi:hypothetical protein
MGWFLITILLPLLAPIALLLLVRSLVMPPPWAKTAMTDLFKEGQLCWLAMSFCASALHELASNIRLRELLTPELVGYVNAILIIILLAAGMTAGVGNVFRASPGAGDQRLVKLSVALTLAAASCYTAVHYLGQ